MDEAVGGDKDHGPMRLDPTSEMYHATTSQAQNRTWDLRDRDDPKLDGATGVAVKIGSRCFLATAAHFLKKAPNIEIVRRQGRDPIGLDFRNAYSEEQLDVGLLELSAGQAEKIRDFVEEKNIHTGLDQRTVHNVLVVGFPACEHHRVAQDLFEARGNTVQSCSVPLGQWPEGPPENPLIAGRDFLVEYPSVQDVQVTGPGINYDEAAAIPAEPPEPRGMSGGGIWLDIFAHRQAGIQFPHIQLIAIQVKFLRTSRLLRGTLIEHWLDLVAKSYPDLRDDVQRIKHRTDLDIGG